MKNLCRVYTVCLMLNLVYFHKKNCFTCWKHSAAAPASSAIKKVKMKKKKPNNLRILNCHCPDADTNGNIVATKMRRYSGRNAYCSLHNCITPGSHISTATVGGRQQKVAVSLTVNDDAQYTLSDTFDYSMQPWYPLQ